MELQSNDLYNIFAPYYRSYSSKRKKYLKSIDSLIKKRVKKANRILDVGAGDGVRGKNIYKETKANFLMQIDSSDEMLKLVTTSEKIHKKKIDITSNLQSKLKREYNVILCLWNVLGHIPTAGKRLQALNNIRNQLSIKGLFFIDVSNAFNLRQYGWFTVFKNILNNIFRYGKGVDIIYPIEVSSGLAVFTKSHFFTEREIINLFRKANFRVEEKYYIDYKTGEKVDSQYLGQLFFVLSVLD